MQRLKAWAEPLVDTADSALAKALDAAERYRETPDPDGTWSRLTVRPTR